MEPTERAGNERLVEDNDTVGSPPIPLKETIAASCVTVSSTVRLELQQFVELGVSVTRIVQGVVEQVLE